MQPAVDSKFDYGDFVIIKYFLEIPKAIELLHSIVEQQIIVLKDLQLPLKIPISQPSFSASNYYHAFNKWPTFFLSTSIDSSTYRQPPYNSLSKLGLPLFPNGGEAIMGLLGIKPPYSNSRSIENRFEIVIPDFRARIRSLRLAGNKITIKVETKEIQLDDLRAKFYCRSEDDSFYTSEDIIIQGNQAQFIPEKEPLEVEAHILSTVDGESLDRMSVNYRYPSAQEDVSIEISETQLLDTVNKGENETVEFKQEIKSVKQFLETVVAFANTKGGRIFIGVGDNCKITGFGEDVKARISDFIDGNCEPSIRVQVNQVKLSNLPITIVEVPEGENKPYNLNNEGIFVRRGASDRKIKRSELEDIYNQRRNSIPRSYQ